MWELTPLPLDSRRRGRGASTRPGSLGGGWAPGGRCAEPRPDVAAAAARRARALQVGGAAALAARDPPEEAFRLPPSELHRMARRRTQGRCCARCTARRKQPTSHCGRRTRSPRGGMPQGLDPLKVLSLTLASTRPARLSGGGGDREHAGPAGSATTQAQSTSGKGVKKGSGS